MTTDKCDDDVFKTGDAICIVDACKHRMEKWVQKVAERSGQKVDWHYSGGIGNVLYLGDYGKVFTAVRDLRDDLKKEMKKGKKHRCRCGGDKHDVGTLMRVYPAQSHGVYRAGDPLPEGVVAVDTH